jgi:hypothetical protein
LVGSGALVAGTAVGAVVAAGLVGSGALVAGTAVGGTAVGAAVGGALVGSGVGAAHATTINASATSASNANFFISSPPGFGISDFRFWISDFGERLQSPPLNSMLG